MGAPAPSSQATPSHTYPQSLIPWRATCLGPVPMEGGGSTANRLAQHIARAAECLQALAALEDHAIQA